MMSLSTVHVLQRLPPRINTYVDMWCSRTPVLDKWHNLRSPFRLFRFSCYIAFPPKSKQFYLHRKQSIPHTAFIVNLCALHIHIHMIDFRWCLRVPPREINLMSHKNANCIFAHVRRGMQAEMNALAKMTIVSQTQLELPRALLLHKSTKHITRNTSRPLSGSNFNKPITFSHNFCCFSRILPRKGGIRTLLRIWTHRKHINVQVPKLV